MFNIKTDTSMMHKKHERQNNMVSSQKVSFYLVPSLDVFFNICALGSTS